MQNRQKVYVSEEMLGSIMAQIAHLEGNRAGVPEMVGKAHHSRYDDEAVQITEVMLSVMDKWQEPKDIIERVREVVGGHVKPKAIWNRLNANATGRFESRFVGEGTSRREWRLAK